MPVGDLVKFLVTGHERIGKLRREEKLLDWYLIDGLDGRRYLIAENEIIQDEKKGLPHHEKREVHPTGQTVQEKKKRGRPRKTS